MKYSVHLPMERAIGIFDFFSKEDEQRDDRVIVFELPVVMPISHCGGGGHPVNFQMVDWFGYHETLTLEDSIAILKKDLHRKTYYKPDRVYLALSKSGQSWLLDPRELDDETDG